MRSLVSTILLLSVITPFTLADYAISSPGTSTTWKCGENQKAQWSVIAPPSGDQTVNVKLMRGPASNLQPVATLCSNVDPNSGNCTFVVPGNLQSDRNYAVTVGNDNNVNHIGYSSFFNVQCTGELPPQNGCPNFGGQNCPVTLPCCSSAGYCGDTDAYCGQGCMTQYSFNGLCAKPGGAPVSTPVSTPEKPSTEKPSTEKPPTKKPPTKKTSTKKASTKKASTKKPSTKKPSTKKPSTKKPSTNESSKKKGGK